MSKSLPLLLERQISTQPKANKLAMPLDRKLGELSRYTYVYADALPLRMERRISEQPQPNALALAMTNLRGVLMPPIYVTSNALPLPLSVPISVQPASNVLPLSMRRRLGTLIGALVIVPPVDPDEPTDPEEPLPDYAPPFNGIASCFSSRTSAASIINDSQTWQRHGQLIAYDYFAMRSPALTIAQNYALSILGLIPLAQCVTTLSQQMFKLSACKSNTYIPFMPIFRDSSTQNSASIGYVSCVKAYSAPVASYRHCTSLPLQPVIGYATSATDMQFGRSIEQYSTAKVSKAVQVPCRYYPIPEPPPVKPDNNCRIRPPSSHLPLMMRRKRYGLLSSNLPLSMSCWHDEPPQFIPNLRSYIVHNVITATVGGIAVDILSFSIKTDMSSYCWQGDIDITPTDYAKIKHKLGVPRGSEPMINVVINDFVFSFIAEEQQRSRQFANHTHSLSGRSITARLGADYAQAQSGILDQSNYASQIVNSQLNGLSVTVDNWGIDDWLIPANSYAVGGKTPIAVISDIASAAGGFVTTDPSQAVISIKPRWKVAAWELASSTPDVTVPMDVIQQISDQKRTNPRFNTVTLVSASEGGVVYRNGQARDADAPTQDHALYTDRDSILPAGTAILSDSGIHSDYTLKMRWADKYNIPLAALGQIWQINDPEGAWRGVVKSVTISVGQDNNAPIVWQTVNIDRYLDV